jgi:acyl-CoA reductase-like NAD-dependent aldehyde dehydrogenase
MSIALRRGTPQFPSVSGAIPPSDQASMDRAVGDLQAHKDAWIAVSPRERVAILDRLIADFTPIAPRWVAACLEAKGLAADGSFAGEEWSSGPYGVVRNLRLLRESLADLAAGRKPRIPGPVGTLPNGQVTAQVFPTNTYDKLFFSGVKAEVWMEPGVTAADLPQTQAVAYAQPPSGKVALVLGAGNVSSIGPLDTFYKLFVEDQVVLFKANPVNAYIGPLMETAFRTLVDRGVLRFAYGGAAEGAYLCQHPGIDEIHITGSDKTFDAIVFGSGPEGALRKAENRPLLAKHVTGELGNVTPIIVVPGPWSESDLAYQAEHIVTMLTNNAGFNCIAGRVIIQHAGWAQRDALLRQIRATLARVPTRSAFYPGAADRLNAFTAAHAEAEQFGTASGDQLPWTLIAGVSPDQTDDIVYTTEAFCGLFAETPLDSGGTAEYIDRAVAFCNDNLWGSLNANIIVHPTSLKDPAICDAVERAVANLRYGTVAMNYWSGTSFVLGTTTWGAFPGHALSDIQSGNGIVHNTLMFSRPQKTVLRGPFRATPTPPWFATRGNAARAVFPRLADLEAAPSPVKVPAIVLAALKR